MQKRVFQGISVATATILAASFRAVRADGAPLSSHVEEGRIAFVGGSRGDHSIALSASDEDRVRAHWEGYVEANGGRPAPRRVLVLGAPGSGKTMLARRIAAGLPRPSGQDAVDLGWIFVGAGIADGDTVQPRLTAAPFRAPHHTVSEAGLVGGGPERVRPGEASLAHAGCLYLDELPEFSRRAVDALAATLREGEHAVRRRGGFVVRIPARPAAVVASANVCPCGWRGTACACSAEALASYTTRLVDFCERLGIKEIVALQPFEASQFLSARAAAGGAS